MRARLAEGAIGGIGGIGQRIGRKWARSSRQQPFALGEGQAEGTMGQKGRASVRERAWWENVKDGYVCGAEVALVPTAQALRYVDLYEWTHGLFQNPLAT